MSGIRYKSPSAALEWAVEAYVLRHETGPDSPVLLLPEIRPAIQIFLSASYWTRSATAKSNWVPAKTAALWGPRYEVAYGWSSPDVLVAAIILTAAGCRALLGAQPRVFANRIVALSPDLETALYDSLKNVSGIDAIAASFAKVIEERLDSTLVQPCTISRVLSTRQQRRIFVDEWGIGPKKHARFERLDRLIRSLHQQPWEGPGVSPPELNFYDQSHLIRECVALTTLTPRQIRIALKLSKSAAIRSIAVPWVMPPES